jgi:hypothetical protein
MVVGAERSRPPRHRSGVLQGRRRRFSHAGAMIHCRLHCLFSSDRSIPSSPLFSSDQIETYWFWLERTPCLFLLYVIGSNS